MPRAAMVTLLAIACLTGLVVLLRGPGGSTPRGVDLEGNLVNPLGPGVTVLVFVDRHCPISNRYMPTLRSLKKAYEPRGVTFWLVYPDASPGQVAGHLRDYEPGLSALRDPEHELVRFVGATTVPEACVLSRCGSANVLSYRGRIDDRFVDFGVARPQAENHELQTAIEAVLEDPTATLPSVPAVGCPIPRGS